MESVDVSFDYYKAILYNDDLKGLDGDSGDGDKDETDHSVPDERAQPVSERADRQASLHLLQKIDDWSLLVYMTQLLLLGKFEYTGGPIFKVVLEC